MPRFVVHGYDGKAALGALEVRHLRRLSLLSNNIDGGVCIGEGLGLEAESISKHVGDCGILRFEDVS